MRKAISYWLIRVCDLGIEAFLSEHAVETINLLDHLPLGALANAFGIAHVMNRFTAGLEKDALKFAGKKTARPLPRGDRLRPGTAGRSEHDKPRQIFRLGA
jgi:hypothetical protein